MATLIKIHEDRSEEFKEDGARVEAIKYDNDSIFESIVNNKSMVRCSLLVSSVTARTYQH